VTLRSMTGIGRASGPVGPDRVAELSVRSVNHRALDLNVKVRETEASLEPLLRRVFSRRFARGKVDVALQMRRLSTAGREVAVDEALLEAFLARLSRLAEKYPVVARLEPRDLLAVPQLFTFDEAPEELSGADLEELEGIANRAADALIEMREAEGARVSADLAGRIERLRDQLSSLASRRAEIAARVRDNVRERLRAIAAEFPMDPGRLEQEAALAADRSDISEELHRLEGHLEQFGELVASARDPVGKKLEFLCQEILRELNTLGSKARDLPLVREVVDMKSELEKIREQVANVE
jgi:uncharacterized protein (TIGR00255 family)